MLDESSRKLKAQIKRCSETVQALFRPESLSIVWRPNRLRRKAKPKTRAQSRVLFVLATLSLTSAVGHRFYNEPQLDVHTIAPQTLKAASSTSVVDTKTTSDNRRAARIAAVPVLMIDQSVNQEIYQSLQRSLSRNAKLRQTAGSFPFVETSVLSTQTQLFLRQAEEWDWQTAVAAVGTSRSVNSRTLRASISKGSASAGTLTSNAALRLAIIELKNYRQTYSEEDFSVLQEVISRARRRYANALTALSKDAIDKPSALYSTAVLNLTEAEWVNAQATIQTVLRRVLSQGITPGLPNSLLEAAVKVHFNSEMPPATSSLTTQMLMSVLKPNLVQDQAQTQLMAEQAAQAVQDVVVEIRQDEVIVNAGDRITQEDFVLLDYFGLSRRRVNWAGLLGFGSLIAGAVTVFLLVEWRLHVGLRRRDHLLVLLLALSTPLVIILNIPAVNLPAVGLLIGSFYGSALGVTTVALLSLIVPIGMDIAWTSLVASAAGSLLGALIAGRSRSREELALLGGIVGLVQGGVYLLLTLIVSPTIAPVWYVVLTTAAMQGLMGIAWSIVALGISPYLEHLFDLITPMRLAELSSPNRPLIKRLASEAPGTFQHTLFVATLAEAAARSLGCNVELVRAGTLYHDIGKMHDPLGFIENQMGGPNKHDVINDPWKSAALIKKHVSAGLVMARKHRLPKAVQAFIPEHQGTMSIAYFHHQAQQRAAEDPRLAVNDADFCYDGPVPQTRETALVMLADSCEAALRSLKDATPDEALAMVNRILRARWQDGQLLDSRLSRAEMTQIAEVFVQVWLQFNHQRIPYPKAALAPQAAPTP